MWDNFMWTRVELKNNAKIVFSQNYWKSVLVAILTTISTGGFGSGSGSSSSSGSSSFSGGASDNHVGIAPPLVIFMILGIVLAILALTLGLAIFVFGPLEVSCRRFFIFARTAPGNLSQLSFAFKKAYMNIVKIQFLRGLFTLGWTLLFIIPGIIKGLEYRMIPYILAENPEISSVEAFNRSREMMTGHKWNAFVLDLSFLGWHILGLFTCFILTIFYVNPYQQLTNAELYEALKLNT
ncbi:MAG: DUF975 family protein [Lachnospiraceae bacterium]|nr:DUF975 family protein [Lachnospiraceae bacterium]